MMSAIRFGPMEYAERRRRLADRLRALNVDAVVVGDWRDLLYLTGYGGVTELGPNPLGGVLSAVAVVDQDTHATLLVPEPDHLQIPARAGRRGGGRIPHIFRGERSPSTRARRGSGRARASAHPHRHRDQARLRRERGVGRRHRQVAHARGSRHRWQTWTTSSPPCECASRQPRSRRYASRSHCAMPPRRQSTTPRMTEPVRRRSLKWSARPCGGAPAGRFRSSWRCHGVRRRGRNLRQPHCARAICC